MKVRVLRAAGAVLMVGLAACSTDGPLTPARREAVQALVTDAQVTVVVTNENDDGPGSLREAIATAPAGSVIGFNASVVTINLASPLSVTRAITVQGPPAPARVTIRGSEFTSIFVATAPLVLRHLTLQEGKSPTVGGALRSSSSATLEDVLAQYNYAESAGAIAVTGNLRVVDSEIFGNEARFDIGGVGCGTSCEFINSRIRSNTGDFGGGVSGGNMTFTETEIAANRARISGGGIRHRDGALVLNNSKVTSNVASRRGAGVFSENGDVRITGTLISGNQIFASFETDIGGGIFRRGDIAITSSTLTNNTADVGGALVVSDGVATIEGGRFGGNGAARTLGLGGAIFVDTTGVLQLRNATLESNTAYRGGAIYLAGIGTVASTTLRGNMANAGAGLMSERNVTVVNSTFSANTATGVAANGGAFAIASGRANIRQTTIAMNQATQGGAYFARDAEFVNISGSIIAGNTSVTGDNCAVMSYESSTPVLVDDIGCLKSPLSVFGSPDLQPLANNGGPTFTHALGDNSTAIDGDTGCATTVDQRGIPRPQGLRCDLGALEFNNYATSTMTVDGVGTVGNISGVAVVSGTVACSRATPVTLEVLMSQSTKVGKTNVTTEAKTQVSLSCGVSRTWTAGLIPVTGAFVAAPVTVTVRTVQGGSVAPASVTRTGVKMSWSKR